MRRLLFLLSPLFMLLLLTACSSKPEPTPLPTTLALTIRAGSDINPSDMDKAAPLQVRLYELTDSTLFQQADFLSLYLEDTATLQSSLIKKHSLPTVQPDSTQTLNFQLDSATRYVAVLGEFAQYQTAVANVTEAIILNQSNALILNINDNHLRLTTSSNPAIQQLKSKEKTNGS